ncbi:MAG: hypothetical protein KDB20_01865, partial [Microthrixaceae bacterium]|nr:hypothetical protein [Microthrixaceae bacterium]
MLHHVWILPALMALSFVLILFFGKRTPGQGHWIGIASIGACLIMSLVIGAQWMQRANEPAHTQAEAFADVNPSCSATAAGFLDGTLHEASHGEEADHAATEAGAEGDHAAAATATAAA